MIENELLFKMFRTVFDMDLPQEKIVLGTSLYLNDQVKILNSNASCITFEIDNTKYYIKYEKNKITYYCKSKQIKKDEYILACLLTFKRDYYIDNEIKFDEKEFSISNYSYDSYFITYYNYNEFKLRYDFYIGLINYLEKIKMVKQVLELIVDIYNCLVTKVRFSDEVKERYRYLKSNLVEKRFKMIIENLDLLIKIFENKTYSISSIASFIETVVLEKPTILFSSNMISIFDNLLESKSQKLNKQYYELINIYKSVSICVRDKENYDVFEDHYDIYEVRYCLVKLLADSNNFDDIYDLFKLYPDVIEISKKENIDKYEILVKSRTDFYRIAHYYDNLLEEGKLSSEESMAYIFILQRAIINHLEQLWGTYSIIPEIILEKFEKMKLIKNGKYYVCETIQYILQKYQLSFSQALIEYCSTLEV